MGILSRQTQNSMRIWRKIQCFFSVLGADILIHSTFQGFGDFFVGHFCHSFGKEVQNNVGKTLGSAISVILEVNVVRPAVYFLVFVDVNSSVRNCLGEKNDRLTILPTACALSCTNLSFTATCRGWLSSPLLRYVHKRRQEKPERSKWIGPLKRRT